jgi:hypothetical protein
VPGHKDLTGDALLKALDTQDEDPSVKSLGCPSRACAEDDERSA